MKRLYGLFVLLCLMLTACNDDFLDVDPVDRYSDAVVWTDESLITSFVNNIYEGQKWGFHTVMLSSLCDESMEVWAWESQPVVMSELSPSYQGILAPNFWIITFHNITWTNLYKNIRACNIFFENAEKYALEGDVVDKLKGEVHYLRAYFYYWLLSQWGGVPLIEKSFTPSDDLLVARNTFEETVDFIVKDLDEAASILPLNGDKARATKGAAMALKARVLLYAASDLFVSQSLWASGYEHPELIGYVGGDRTERWQRAKKAAKAVMDLGIYHLYGENGGWKNREEATQNYADIFLCHNSDEDIMVQYYDYVNHNSSDFQLPRVGLFNSPNGFHGWGGNTPTGQLVDSYEMADGSKFSWDNPQQAAYPYQNRDPRFYASIMYNGSYWRQRPDDTVGSDPEGIVQTAYYQQSDGSYTPGLDTRQGPIEDWNGSYTGYYMRKFLDPSVNHQYDKQPYPWRQIRYAEVLLNYAEAVYERDDKISNTDLNISLNLVRLRVNPAMTPLTNELITQNAGMRTEIRRERTIELFNEGFRLDDLKRWKTAETEMPMDIVGIQWKGTEYEKVWANCPYETNAEGCIIIEKGRKWEEKNYLFPLPSDQLQLNPNLQQNPGWE